MLLENIRIVLIQTSHPGNIGSAARAMKTMGLSDLCLVNPKLFPDEQASAMASGADDILESATVVPSLKQAIDDCEIVIGTSARSQRHLQWPLIDSRECGLKTIEVTQQSKKVALVFGRERTGLTNEELDHCNVLVHIPTNQEYSSLNVASAVQILSYECAMASNTHTVKHVETTEELSSAGDNERFYEHLEQTLIEAEYLDPENPKLLMRRLRRLFGRIDITITEMKILRGMLAAFQKKKSLRAK